jgi:hypothetical protein
MQSITTVKLFVGLSDNLIINKMNIQNQVHRTELLNYCINRNKRSVFSNTDQGTNRLNFVSLRMKKELIIRNNTNKQKLHGLSPRANYTDRATAACRRSDCQLLRIKGATWSA